MWWARDPSRQRDARANSARFSVRNFLTRATGAGVERVCSGSEAEQCFLCHPVDRQFDFRQTGAVQRPELPAIAVGQGDVALVLRPANSGSCRARHAPAGRRPWPGRVPPRQTHRLTQADGMVRGLGDAPHTKTSQPVPPLQLFTRGGSPGHARVSYGMHWCLRQAQLSMRPAQNWAAARRRSPMSLRHVNADWLDLTENGGE